MGKIIQTAKENPLANRTAELHALTRAEEEACYKDLKERALKHCQVPVKGEAKVPGAVMKLSLLLNACR